MESRVRAEKPSVPDTVTASTETNPTPAIPTHRSGPDVSPRGLEPLGRFVRLLGLIGKGPQAKPSVDSSPLMAFAVEGAQPRSNAAGAASGSPRGANRGIIATAAIAILLGIAGALVGGFLASALFGKSPIDGPFDISSIVTAVIGERR